MRARTVHQERTDAGVPLTKTFHGHLKTIAEAEARNPEVQNRYDAALARDRRRPGPDLSFSGNEANPLFHNTGKGFVELGATLGLSRTEDGRGMVLVDLDQDGAQDVVLHNFFKNPLVALLNRAAEGRRWIRVRLRGTTSNRFGIGARVTVNGRVRELACGSGYQSCDAPELHFGLDAATAADLVVRWPSGRTDEYRQLKADRIHELTEGAPAARRELELQAVAIPTPATAAVEPGPDPRAVLAGLRTLKGEPAPLGPGPSIVVFFRLSCHACVEELKGMARLEARAKELGTKLVWVSLDSDPGRVEEEFRLNGAAVEPLLPGRPVDVGPTPAVWRSTPEGVERYSGRHAVTAAFEEASRTK